MRMLMLVIPLLLAIVLADAGLADDAPASTGPDAAADAQPHAVMYLSDAGPIVLQTRVMLDGRPIEQAWEKYVDGLFASLDENGDGKLSREEASRLPPPNLLQQAGLISPVPAAARLASPDVRPRDGRVSRDELGEYLRQIGGGPFVVSVPSAGPTRATRTIQVGGAAAVDMFAQLDRDGDGRLTASEFTFDARLLKLDRDDDQTLSAAELAPYFNPYIARQMVEPSAAAPDAFLSLGGHSGIDDVRLLLARFDGKAAARGNGPPVTHVAVASDNVLTAPELGMTAETLASYDVDGSGGLDFDELRQWLKNPTADVDVLVRLGALDGKPAVEISVGPGAKGRLEFKPAIGEAAAIVSIGKVNLEFAGDGSWATDPKEQLLREFEQADADNNAYVDQQEGRRYATIGSLFELLDADRDGKVFQPELEAWVERWSPAVRSRVELRVAQQGRKLFEILDENRDGRLSDAELRAGAQRIAGWDADGDAALAEAEVPGTWRLSTGRIPLGRSAQVFAVNGPGQGVRRVDVAAPEWFRRMDRNGDGLVGQREFLGPLEDFTRFDANADGQLSPAEAPAK